MLSSYFLIIIFFLFISNFLLPTPTELIRQSSQNELFEKKFTAPVTYSFLLSSMRYSCFNNNDEWIDNSPAYVSITLYTFTSTELIRHWEKFILEHLLSLSRTVYLTVSKWLRCINNNNSKCSPDWAAKMLKWSDFDLIFILVCCMDY